MPPKKSSQFLPFKGKCKCGKSKSEGALPSKRCRKFKVVRWVKIRSGDKIGKLRMLVKKPTPYPLNRNTVPKIRAHHRVPMPMPMPTEASNQRREMTPPPAPPCEALQEVSHLMTPSQLGATESEERVLSPMFKGMVLGLRLGRRINHDLANGTPEAVASFMQAVQKYQTQLSALPPFGNPSLERQESEHTTTTNGDSSQPGSSGPMTDTLTSELQQDDIQKEPLVEQDYYTHGPTNPPECSILYMNKNSTQTESKERMSIGSLMNFSFDSIQEQERYEDMNK